MALGEFASNKSLQMTFDPPAIFACAKTAGGSNAPELRRYTVVVVSLISTQSVLKE